MTHILQEVINDQITSQMSYVPFENKLHTKCMFILYEVKKIKIVLRTFCIKREENFTRALSAQPTPVNLITNLPTDRPYQELTTTPKIT
jgi:hypothetical protein